MVIPKQPKLDKKLTRLAVEKAFEIYRELKYIQIERKYTNIVQVMSDMPKASSGRSDQTSEVATYNVDQIEERKIYVDLVEEAVNDLPEIEREIIEQKYMQRDSKYITHYMVYTCLLSESMTNVPYDKRRWSAIKNIALRLDLAVEKSD